MRDHAAVMLVTTPKGVVVVREPGKPQPIYWKLPGGMGEPGETPVQTAWRELLGETGIRVELEKFRSLIQIYKPSHDYYVFRVDLDYVPELVERGHEGEEPAIMTPQEVLAANNFLPPQLKLIRRHLEKLLKEAELPRRV